MTSETKSTIRADPRRACKDLLPQVSPLRRMTQGDLEDNNLNPLKSLCFPVPNSPSGHVYIPLSQCLLQYIKMACSCIFFLLLDKKLLEGKMMRYSSHIILILNIKWLATSRD